MVAVDILESEGKNILRRVHRYEDEEIIADYPEFTEEGLHACPGFVVDQRDRRDLTAD